MRIDGVAAASSIDSRAPRIGCAGWTTYESTRPFASSTRSITRSRVSRSSCPFAGARNVSVTSASSVCVAKSTFAVSANDSVCAWESSQYECGSSRAIRGWYRKLAQRRQPGGRVGLGRHVLVRVRQHQLLEHDEDLVAECGALVGAEQRLQLREQLAFLFLVRVMRDLLLDHAELRVELLVA